VWHERMRRSWKNGRSLSTKMDSIRERRMKLHLDKNNRSHLQTKLSDMEMEIEMKKRRWSLSLLPHPHLHHPLLLPNPVKRKLRRMSGSRWFERSPMDSVHQLVTSHHHHLTLLLSWRVLFPLPIKLPFWRHQPARTSSPISRTWECWQSTIPLILFFSYFDPLLDSVTVTVTVTVTVLVVI
jgi:hypothetical protein